MGSKRKRDEEKVICTLIGTNSTTVTGSCLKVENGVNEKFYLLDCGINQEKSVEENMQANLSILDSIGGVANIEYVFLSHAHG